MIADFVLEIVAAPGSGATITLPGSAPTGRRTWAAGFVTSQPFVFYVLDDSLQQEWGVGTLTIGSPSTIIRPTVVLGNSAGTTARLNFATAPRCYSGLPSAAAIGTIASRDPRNLLHNGLDTVQQRGAGPWTVASIASDRWGVTTGTAGGTRSVTIATLADADRTAIGDEDATYATQYVFSGGAAAGDLDQLYQNTENVRRTAGKSVTVSFWAKAASGTPKIGINLQQFFGTGGSPSATVWNTAQTVTLSTTWTRYALTFAIPTIVGKTLGTTAGTSIFGLALFLSSGSTNNANAGAIGVQAATISLFGRQMEFGAFPTPLEKQDAAATLINCQRFYQIGTVRWTGFQNATSGFGASQSLPVAMRALPTLVLNATTTTNCTSPTLTGLDVDTIMAQATATASAPAVLVGTFTASADL